MAGTQDFYNIPASNTEIESTDGIIHGLETGEFLRGRYTRENFKNWQDHLSIKIFLRKKLRR